MYNLTHIIIIIFNCIRAYAWSYTYTHTHTHTYIYIYRERERENSENNYYQSNHVTGPQKVRKKFYNFNQRCVANPPTHQNRPDPTQPAELGQFLGMGGFSWVWFITITTRLTRLDPPIYLNFKLYIFKTILYN